MFVLQPKPTFEHEIVIPVPGGGEGKFTVIFRHKGKKELNAFYEALGSETGRNDVDALAELIEGWKNVDEKYSRDALEKMLDAYPGAALALFEGYRVALFEGRRKN